MKRSSLSRMVIASITVGIGISTILLGFLWVGTEYRHHEAESTELRKVTLQARREHLREEVEDAVSYVQHMRKRTRDRVRETIRERAEEAHAVARGLVERYGATKTRAELEEMVREALRGVRFNGGRGYYFAIRMDGIAALAPLKPSSEGTSLLALRDTLDRPVIADMIEIARVEGEGFYEYLWTHPQREGSDFDKISYVKYFAPFDWLIGTGDYPDDIEREIQDETLHWLSQVKVEGPYNDGYLFIGQWNGMSLSHPTRGRDMWEVADAEGVKIVQELIAQAKGGGGFVTYVMPDLGGEKTKPKISYVAGVPEWRWYIGTGAYVEDIEEEYRAAMAMAWGHARENILKALALTAVIALVGALIALAAARRTQREIQTLDAFLKKASTSHELLPLDKVRYREFRRLARTANQMIRERNQTQGRLEQSEERLELALAATETGIWDWDIASQKTYFSLRYLSMLGYGPDELPHTFATWDRLLHPDDKERVRRAVESALASEEKAWRIRFRMRHKNGAYRWILGSGKVVALAADGSPIRASGTHVDITDRVIEEGRFSAIVNSAPWGMHMYKLLNDDRLIFTGANQSADVILGIDHATLAGKKIEDAFPELRQTEVPTIYRNLAREGGTWYSEQIDYDDTTIKGAYEVRAFQIAPREVVVTFLDITERIRHESEKTELAEQLRQSQKMEAVGTLAGGIAHDFNNILGAIVGYGELARMESLPNGRAWEYLGSILKATDRARELVQQILAFSRKAEIVREPFRPRVVVEEGVKLLAASIPKTIEIRADIARSQGTVIGDPTQYHQVLINLCTNAYQAMRDKGGALTLRLEDVEIDQSAAQPGQGLVAGSYVRLTVADEGPGIAAELRDRIFEPFFTTKGVGEGTGMGLAVVHGIVRAMGGAIVLSSEAGRGATFEVYVPRDGSAKAVREHPPDEAPRGHGMVLFVDDEEMLVTLGSALLLSLGYEAEVFTSPRAALAELRAHPDRYDLLITDQTMAEMTGEELTGEALKVHPGLPVILCTGYSERMDEAKARAIGAKGFLLKPIKRQVLAEMIRTILDEGAG